DDQPQQPHPGGLEAYFAQARRQDQAVDPSAAQRGQGRGLCWRAATRRQDPRRRELRGSLVTIRTALSALLLCAAIPASAQLGAAPQSPPPEGVAADAGAGNPKGHYHELDALPDWGGIWFVEGGASR